MIVLLLVVPVACAAVGVVLYFALKGVGILPGYESGGYQDDRTFSLRSPRGILEWLDEISPGWLIAVITAAAIWIVAWIVVLTIGLRFLQV